MSGTREDDDEVDELSRAFGEALRDVVPLSDRSLKRVPPARQRRPPEPALQPAPTEADQHAVTSTYAAAGVDRREVRKLARGECRIEATLNLHGKTAAEAEAALRHFLQRARHAGYRHVCVVTGVGHHSAAGAVLKPKVAMWLRQNAQVLAFTPAPPASGGTGALYVWLRRRHGAHAK